MKARREETERNAPLQVRAADRITRFVGSMTFVYLHLVIFGLWALINSGVIGLFPKWDETFVILGTTASVEAIFLSTFVLISQNRMSELESKRADLDLQISLFAEHEITRLIHLVSQMADKLGVEAASDPDFEEIAKDVAPEAVLDRIEQ